MAGEATLKSTLRKAIVTATARTQAQFYDLDPLNIVWHGNYARFFELGRSSLLDRIAYNYKEMRESGHAWPVVDFHVRYYRPFRLNQSVDVTAGIVEWENRLKVNYLITDVDTGQRLTKGHTVHVAVEVSTEEMLWETPPILRKKLAPFLR